MTTLTSVAAVAAQTLVNMTKRSQMYSREKTSEPSNSSKTIIISTSDTSSLESIDNAMTNQSSLSPTDTLSPSKVTSQLLRTLTENAKPDSGEILEDRKRIDEVNTLKYNSDLEQTGSGKCIRYVHMNNDGMSSVPDAENEGENVYFENHTNIASGTARI